jgi:hypothetical protein
MNKTLENNLRRHVDALALGIGARHSPATVGSISAIVALSLCRHRWWAASRMMSSVMLTGLVAPELDPVGLDKKARMLPSRR